jgi:hypothetical protein
LFDGYFEYVSEQSSSNHLIIRAMKKISLIVFIFLCFGCFEKKESNLKFSKVQIEQLGLSNSKPLRILDRNRLILDLNNFLSEKEISAGDIVDSIKYIPLQTTDESLIAEVNKLICIEHYFFILDSDIGKNVFIFSDEGVFIKRISTGQGPEEIYNPGDIAVDETQSHLIVYNRKGLSFYDYHGNFVKREILPFNFKNFRVLSNGYLFITVPNQNGHLEEFSEMQVLITDKNFRIISAGFPFHYSNTLNYGITDYTSSLEKEVNFSFKFSNKIYQYVDTLSVQEKYQLNFSKKELPVEYLKLNSKEVLNTLKNNNYYYFMGNFAENDTHEYFAIYNDYNRKAYQTFIFRDKLSGELKGGNKITLDDNIPLFGYPLTAYKNEFIGAISSNTIQHYLSNTEKGREKNVLFAHVDEDSNPILVRYKIQ